MLGTITTSVRTGWISPSLRSTPTTPRPLTWYLRTCTGFSSDVQVTLDKLAWRKWELGGTRAGWIAKALAPRRWARAASTVVTLRLGEPAGPVVWDCAVPASHGGGTADIVGDVERCLWTHKAMREEGPPHPAQQAHQWRESEGLLEDNDYAYTDYAPVVGLAGHHVAGGWLQTRARVEEELLAARAQAVEGNPKGPAVLRPSAKDHLQEEMWTRTTATPSQWPRLHVPGHGLLQATWHFDGRAQA